MTTPSNVSNQTPGGCPKCPCPAWRHPKTASFYRFTDKPAHLNRRPGETFLQLEKRLAEATQ